MTTIGNIGGQADGLIKLAQLKGIGLPASYSGVTPNEKARVLAEFRPVFDAILERQEKIKE